jgi:hypothetical protein
MLLIRNLTVEEPYLLVASLLRASCSFPAWLTLRPGRWRRTSVGFQRTTWHRTLSIFIYFFIFLGWGEIGSTWPIVPAPDDKWWWSMRSSRWNETWQGKQKYSEKTCPNAALSTTNATWPDLGSNLGRRCGKQTTNRLSYGTACHTLEDATLYDYHCEDLISHISKVHLDF